VRASALPRRHGTTPLLDRAVSVTHGVRVALQLQLVNVLRIQY